MTDFIKNEHQGQSGIIYWQTKKETEKTAKELKKTSKIKWAYFHAGISHEERNKIQRQWMKNEVLIIVATVAFGMGINKKDVRFVIHTSSPKSIEAYIQECGRAGRDDKDSKCVLYYNYGDRKMLDFFIMNTNEGSSASPARKEENIHNLYKMLDYCEEKVVWRRQHQLSLLGEKFSSKNWHEKWDNCRKQEYAEDRDVTEEWRNKIIPVIK